MLILIDKTDLITRRAGNERLAQQGQSFDRDLEGLEANTLQRLGVSDELEQLFH